jgi:hypothetical protein
MKKINIFALAVLAAFTTLPMSAQNDTLAIAKGDTLAIGSSYTLALNNIQLKSATSDVAVKVMRPLKSGDGTVKYYGTYLHFTNNSIYTCNGGDTTVLVKNLTDGMDAHSYTIIRKLTTAVRVYRDNAWIATLRESKMTDTSCYFTLFSTDQLKDGYTCQLLSQTEALLPDESVNETNIGNMLPASMNNLAEDPYCNHGVNGTGLNAADRSFIANNASYGGWGPAAYMDSQNAYSGKHCIRIEGQAVYSDQGASVDQAINFASGCNYLVRAMVKSDGYEGKIAIEGETNYLHITDTGGKWVQIEGLLSTSGSRSNLYVNNRDFTNSGTLYIDNFEVYKGYTATSAIGSSVTEVASVPVEAGVTWSPTNKTNVYMLGLTDNGTKYAQIDTTKVSVKSGVYLKKTVAGSQFYAMSFPGDLTQMTVTGSFDGNDYADAPLTLNVDYVLQKYTYPTFSYLGDNDAATQGSYLIQFVDNLQGSNVTFKFAKPSTDAPASTALYNLIGNPYYCDYAPAGTFLKFDEKSQRFLRTSGETVKPFEAYIATSAAAPVSQIVPNSTSRIFTASRDANGSRLGIRTVEGGIIVTALAAGNMNIYNAAGQIVRQVALQEGANNISLKKGLYITAGKKFCVAE